MKNIVFKKENGTVRIVNANEELINRIKGVKNCPCFTCDNGYASKCPKMEDENKDIEKYDFITDGYQINNEKGELENFIVCECTKYALDRPRKKASTKEEIAQLKYLKESIKILYFDAIDINEADQIQLDQFRRGSLIGNVQNNKTFSK